MKFLVDAQLPRRLSQRLDALGHNATHTLDLPKGNRTPDAVINELSAAEERVVVTKDADFVDALIVQGVPYKLLLFSREISKLSESRCDGCRGCAARLH